jgi:hypothetical protein
MKSKYQWVCSLVLLCLASMASCDRSPSGPDKGSLLGEGFTSGGRKFQVFGTPFQLPEDSHDMILAIEGERDVVIPHQEKVWWESYVKVKVDSIRVFDLPGAPALVYIDWQSYHDGVTLRRDSIVLYHYAAFASGQSPRMLIEGVGFQDIGGNPTSIYHLGEGSYDVTYADNVVTIAEHWRGFLGDGGTWDPTGVAEEKRVSRTFRIHSQDATPLTCAEWIRTLNTTLSTHAQLDAVAWTQRVAAPADDPYFCMAINPKRCILEGICTRQ